MPNNYLSVLYKHIIQVENKKVGLKVGGTNIPLPPIKNVGARVPLSPPPLSRFLRQCTFIEFFYNYCIVMFY